MLTVKEKTVATLRKKYACIVRWETRMGASKDYIDAVVRQAEKDNAPITAIYFNFNKKERWHLAEEIKNEELRKHILGG